jgi:predicted RNase H-like nuclease
MPLGRVSSDGVVIQDSRRVESDEQIVAWAHNTNGPLTAAIDAPTVVPNEEGMRPCENQLLAYFAVKKSPCGRPSDG